MERVAGSRRLHSADANDEITEVLALGALLGVALDEWRQQFEDAVAAHVLGIELVQSRAVVAAPR